MSTLATLVKLVAFVKRYGPTIAAVASGIGMIVSKDYDQGLSTIFQALTVLFGGASVASLQHAAARSAPG
jgi:hypothetical protein